jgi:flagellar biosynthesis protein FliP
MHLAVDLPTRLHRQRILADRNADVERWAQRHADRLHRFIQGGIFAGLAGIPPTEAKDLPLSVVVPAFLINELRTAFQMGFLVFLPFLLIDYVVAIILMSLGLMFLPPANISMRLKFLLFVLVDGWGLITKSLVNSFL